ncbi:MULTISPECIES: hypothetical protein [unclassified Rhizobium]|uniref:hypothetical protein n=1 Tax=unclassified Rhizobium TaxID=2613769 RepID=UPI00167661BD|nr:MULTISPECIES: hypothetical protein [unclassified Rhizobium]
MAPGAQANSAIASLILFGSSATLSLGALANMFDNMWAKIIRELVTRLQTGLGL